MSLLKYSGKGLSVGQHTLIKHNAYQPWDRWVERMKSDSSISMKHQVHNFTWKKSDIEKFRHSKFWNVKGEAGTTPINRWADEEYDAMTDYFTKNKTLNLDDKRFFIDYCPTDNFHDYKFWEQVKEIPSYPFT